jgi:hypothetical protein
MVNNRGRSGCLLRYPGTTLTFYCPRSMPGLPGNAAALESSTGLLGPERIEFEDPGDPVQLARKAIGKLLLRRLVTVPLRKVIRKIDGSVSFEYDKLSFLGEDDLALC